MSPTEAMHRINELTAHVWMVRTFLKHCDEAAEDDELMEVPRGLYDYMLALGPSWDSQDADAFVKMARKKLAKLKRTVADFHELQPEISDHMNFKMARLSLEVAVREIEQVLEQVQA